MKPQGDSQSTLGPGLTLLALVLAGWLLYWPGVSGAFLFDDWKNLGKLGDQGTIDSIEKVVTYLLSGFAGPTGRPVSLASFLLDANTWPAPPAPFKHTNILIHLLNGALLTALLFQIALWLRAPRTQAAWIAVLAAAIWMLHPLWVSTTLYVVQRMAMLAATFTLAGLVSYAHGRSALAAGRTLRGYAWMTLGVAGFGLLAILSKENGALLPLFILVLEALVFRSESPGPQTRPARPWRWLFLYLPAALVIGYVVSVLPALLSGDTLGRSFTPGQRLLTEFRILVDYLANLLLPGPYSSGLFNDNITVSTGLLTPITTALSGLTLLMLGGCAFIFRHRLPTLWLAVAFFLVGHLLESTIIPLEPYFEHRNYLPAALIGLPIAWYLVMTPSLTPRHRWLVALVLLALLSAETGLRIRLWGEPFNQALVWASENPQSPRAQNHLANLWMDTGNYLEARRLIGKAMESDPNDLASRMNLFLANCRANVVSKTDIHSLRSALLTQDDPRAVTRYQLETTLTRLRQRTCGAWSPAALPTLLEAALHNADGSQAAWRQILLQLRGQAALDRGDPNVAYRSLIASLHARPSRQGILKNAALLAQFGYFERALSMLDEAPRPKPPRARSVTIGALREAWLQYTGYYRREMAHMRQTICGDLKASCSASD